MRRRPSGTASGRVTTNTAARVAGELGAGTALAGEQDPEELLDDMAEVVRRAGREFHEMLQVGALPTAGNA